MSADGIVNTIYFVNKSKPAITTEAKNTHNKTTFCVLKKDIIP